MGVRRTLAAVFVVGLVASIATLAGLAGPAFAAGFTVDSTGDAGDAVPGDGVCATAGGVCTLRAAVEEANTTAATDNIQVPAGTINLGADLEVTTGVISIRGASDVTTILDGGNSDRLFTVDGGGLTLRHIRLQNGGGVQSGGAIRVLDGGLQVADSVIADNSAFTGGGGVHVNPGQTFDIRRTEIIGNDAVGAFGGGLWNQGNGKLLDSLVHDNDSNRAGGIDNTGQIQLRNVTLSDNVAHSPTAGTGAMRNIDFAFLNNVTVTGNSGHDRSGGILTTSGATTVLKNSIIFGNTDTGTANEDCQGDFSADSRYNVLGETSGCGLPGVTTTWLLGVDPLLFSIADNGGPTRTRAIPSNSPARDAGFPFPPGGPAADSCEAADQRGFQRLKCDMGAFEVFVPVPTVLDVFVNEDGVDVSPGDGECAAASGFCTLRAAVQESNWLPGTQTITLSGNTYQLTEPSGFEGGFDPAEVGDLDILDNVVIEGFVPEPDIVTIDADDNYRVFDIHPGVSAVMQGLTITGGNDLGGGGIRLTSAQLNLQSVRVIGNESSVSGGGIATGGLDEILTISNSLIQDNTAPFFGGSGAGISSGGTLTIGDSRIVDNSGSGSGGGIRASGPTTLTRVVVSGNQANGGISNGGGISATQLSLTESLVYDNTSGSHGGGVFASNGTITNTTIFGNIATTDGGGVSTNGDLTLRNVTVAENQAGVNGTSTNVFGSGAEIMLDNTILASSLAGDECDGPAHTSLGHNLADDASCALVAVGDQQSTDADLGPLSDNGGPTHTALPNVGGPAVDTGSDSGVGIDQRGIARPAGLGFDIGAAELVPPQVLMVAGSNPPPSEDQPYVDQLTSWGFDVTVINDDGITAGDADGFEVIFVSSSVVPAKVGDTFATTAIPVVVGETFLADDFGMTGKGSGNLRETAGIASINLVAPSHPIADGVSGGHHSYASSPVKIGRGRPAPSAVTVATAGGSNWSGLFTYEAGDVMVDGNAPARRAFVYTTFGMAPVARPVTWALLHNTFIWAASDN